MWEGNGDQREETEGQSGPEPWPYPTEHKEPGAERGVEWGVGEPGSTPHLLQRNRAWVWGWAGAGGELAPGSRGCGLL